MDTAWRWRRGRVEPPAHPGAAPTYDRHDPRDAWRMLPADAFTEDLPALEHGYPADRARVDDARAGGDPRYSHPESFLAAVLTGVTVAPFIIFSGVVDEVMLDPGLGAVRYTFRDDAGRLVGTADASTASVGPLPIRCRRVDVTNNTAGTLNIAVTGYYRSPVRGLVRLENDLTAELGEAYPVALKR